MNRSSFIITQNTISEMSVTSLLKWIRILINSYLTVPIMNHVAMRFTMTHQYKENIEIIMHCATMFI